MITTQTLKNAAFAIEHDLFTDPDGCNYLVKDGAILRRWEPEHSSEDSFDLMVRLRMDIKFLDGFKQVLCWASYDRSHVNTHGIVGYGEGASPTPTAFNVRTAILLAAAEIGASINRSPENH